MNTQTAEINGKGRAKEVLETVGNVAATALDVERLKKRVEYAVEDAVTDAQRLAKRGKYAVEDLVDDTEHLIKKNPWQSVGYVLGAGFGVGLLTGWLMTRSVCNRVTTD
jgi:ElaB/YqjD/DUF883 family membrane-anchored ribosome-binding protein